MNKNKISDTKIALVSFDENNKKKYYSYATFYGDLTADDILLVNTKKGIKSVTFYGYTDSEEIKSLYTKEDINNFNNMAKAWIIGRIDLKDIENNINISETKTDIKLCLETIEMLKQRKGKEIQIDFYNRRLESLLKKYSDLI